MYTVPVKNITLSAEESLIEEARDVARARHTTLNAAFREWLGDYTGRRKHANEFDALMKRLKYVKVDRKYSRDEMNER